VTEIIVELLYNDFLIQKKFSHLKMVQYNINGPSIEYQYMYVYVGCGGEGV
jgi:hypothetical protein